MNIIFQNLGCQNSKMLLQVKKGKLLELEGITL